MNWSQVVKQINFVTEGAARKWAESNQIRFIAELKVAEHPSDGWVVYHEKENDNTKRSVELLKQMALDNYEAGGHYMVECWEDADYIAWLLRYPFLGQAKKELAKHWEHLESVARDIQNA